MATDKIVLHQPDGTPGHEQECTWIFAAGVSPGARAEHVSVTRRVGYDEVNPPVHTNGVVESVERPSSWMLRLYYYLIQIPLVSVTVRMEDDEDGEPLKTILCSDWNFVVGPNAYVPCQLCDGDGKRIGLHGSVPCFCRAS